MYIPIWLIIIAIVIYVIYRLQKNSSNPINNITTEVIEEYVLNRKHELFTLEHFESPHFIDVRDAYEAMEVNYLRLKQRLAHNEEEKIKIAKDWLSYVEALLNFKNARELLDVDMSDSAFDNFETKTKESAIIKEEIEKKFKSLLNKDWQNIPLNYFERIEKMKKPSKKTKTKLGYDDWKYYYEDSHNYLKMVLEKTQKKETS